MNAIIREQYEYEYEAPVLTNEAIEVHLNYLRSGFDSMQAALPVLRDKFDLLATKLDSKIEQVNAKIETLGEKTSARIEAVNASLGEKIDDSHRQRAAGGRFAKIDVFNHSLCEKIDELIERMLEVHAQQKAVLWVFSISSIVAAMVSIARTLNWI
jgi:hypothetical protein